MYKFSLLYLSALFIGFGWVVLPSLSGFLISPGGTHFSTTQYSYLPIALNIGAILSALILRTFKKSHQSSRMVFWSLACLATAQLPIYLVTVTDMPEIYNYAFVVLGEFFVGAGIGSMLSLLNVIAINFFPKKRESALVAVYACVSLGTSLMAFFISFFIRLYAWNLIPLIMFGTTSVVAVLFLGVDMGIIPATKKIPSRELKQLTKKNTLLIGFFLIIFSYALIETTFNYWTPLFLHEENLSIGQADQRLSIFWGAVTIGQIISALLAYFFSSRKIYFVLILLLWSTALATAVLKPSNPLPYVIGGLGCSSFFPLTVDFFEKRNSSKLLAASGFVIGVFFIGGTLSLVLLSNIVGWVEKTENLLLYSVLTGVIVISVFSYLLVFRKQDRIEGEM